MSRRATIRVPRLVVRPRPRDGESPDGYLVRVTEANHYPAAYYLHGQDHDIQHIDFTLCCLSPAGRALRAGLEQSLRLEEGELGQRWARYRQVNERGSAVKFGGLNIERIDISTQFTQVCPDCIEESGICFDYWHIRGYTACHHHRRLLLTCCPSCSAPISRMRSRLLSCQRCGHDLRCGGREAVGAKETRLSEALALGYAGSSSAQAGLDPYAPLFDGGLAAGLKVLRTVGGLLMDKRHSWPGPAGVHIAERHRSVMEALALFEGWPRGWFAYLERRAFPADRERMSPRAALRRELALLDKADPSLEFLREATAEWFMSHHPQAASVESMRAFMVSSRRESPLMAVDEAAGQFGISRNTLLQWAGKGLLELQREAVGRDERLFVRREAVAQLQASRSRLLTRKAAAARLGVSPRVLNRLVEDGVIAVAGNDRGRVGSIPVAAVEALLDALQAACIQRAHGKDLSLNAALVMTAFVWTGIGQLVQAVLGKRLPVTAFDRGRGIASLRLLREPLTKLLGLMTYESDAVWMLTQEAAWSLRTTRAYVCQLIDKKVFQQVRKAKLGGRQDWCLQREELEVFKASYVTLGELIERTGRDERWVEGRLEWAGIAPAKLGNGYTIKGLYVREKALDYVAQRLLAPAREDYGQDMQG